MTIDRFTLMVRMRHFEEACREGFESGEIHGELHSGVGLEAIAAGMSEALRTDDAVVSTHRCHLHGLAKRVPADAMLAEIFERETGLSRGRGGHMHLFDMERNFSTTGIVGASLPVALGYAYGYWMEDRDSVAVGVTGDGGAHTGAFHESLNIAGAWKLPYVVLVENNGYAISVPFESVTPTPTIAERGAAYGAWWKRVDGTDVDEVADAFAEAVAHARAGRGPALLEATAYRFKGHFEGDHDLYRTEEYKERMLDHDPIPRKRRQLIESGVTDDDRLEAIVRDSKRATNEILSQVRAADLPDPDDALAHVFAEVSTR